MISLFAYKSKAMAQTSHYRTSLAEKSRKATGHAAYDGGEIENETIVPHFNVSQASIPIEQMLVMIADEISGGSST